MTESLVSQIVIGDSVGFFKIEQNGKVGSNKEAFNKTEYLEAVKKRLTSSPSILSTELGTSRRSVYRFMKRYPDVVAEAKEVLKQIGEAEYSINLNSFENFKQIPSVQRWAEMYERKLVGETKIKARLRALWYMCNHLRVHPMKCSPEQVSKVIVEMRDKTFRGEQPPKGLSYYSQREAWRGYFQMIRGVPGQVMSDLGVDAMASHGSGKYSKQRLTQAQREQFRQGLLELCRNPKNHFNYNHYLEGLAAAKFMYYTGTRRAATCNIDFQNCRFELTPDLWMIEITDKGRRGGIKWEKVLIGHALDEMKDYIAERFKITEDLETEVPKIKALFPSYYGKENLMSSAYRQAFKAVGVRITIPVHIFRHTFAQDCLDATDWKYEMVATLGGWKNTYILKKHYGEMGRAPKLRGLRAAMGLPTEVVSKELKW